jgi:hypothetical protein
MRQSNDRSQFKRMAWKKVVDIILSNFFQTRILPDDKYAVAQRKVLISIVGDRRIQRSASDRGACRSRDDPPNMLLIPIPHLHPKGQVARDVTQVRVG